jgi:hypothetical protein
MGRTEVPGSRFQVQGSGSGSRFRFKVQPEKCMNEACEVYKMAEIIADLCVLT